MYVLESILLPTHSVSTVEVYNSLCLCIFNITTSKRFIRNTCADKYVIGARLLELWAYKRGDARRKDRDLCFAHSLVLCTNENFSFRSLHYKMNYPIDGTTAI